MNDTSYKQSLSQDTSVSFVRAMPTVAAGSRNHVRYVDAALIAYMVREMGPPLRSVARRVRRYGPNDGGCVVLLTGCQRAIGCTSTAVALAVAAATDGPTIILDGDQSHQGLSQAFQPSPTVGWNDVVEGMASTTDALQDIDLCQNVTVLSLSERPARMDGLIGSPRFARMFAELRRNFTLVVVDGGTVRADAGSWAPWVDVALLVCDASENLSAEWAAAWDSLEEKGTHVMGVIETNA